MIETTHPSTSERAEPSPRGFRTLDLSDFAFHEFGDELEKVEQRIRRVGSWSGEPRVVVADGAVFVPSGSGRTAAKDRPYGGMVTAHGEPIDAALLSRRGRTVNRRRDALVEAATERELDEEVVYLGPLFNHYGRLLLESLARIWFLAEADPSLRVVFDYPNTKHKTQDRWALRILEHFGIPASRILVLETPTRLRRAYVPEPLFEQMHAAHESLIGQYRAVAANLAGDVRPSPRPLYLSRRRLTSRQRPIVGEDVLEELLRDNGFVVAHPETMPFADQVRLINAHAHVVASVGSAAHSILFALGKPALHLLTDGDNLPPNYFLCSALAEAPTTFVNCLGTGDRPNFSAERKSGKAFARYDEDVDGPALGPQSTPQMVELPKVAAYLAGCGLLPEGSLASWARQDSALRDRYDEAWLYARVRKAVGRRRTRLPAAIEAEAVERAARSWPLSAVLVRYYAVTLDDPGRAEAMANQFARLVAEETDSERLAHYRGDVEALATRLRRSLGRETATRLLGALEDHFDSAGGSDETGSDDD